MPEPQSASPRPTVLAADVSQPDRHDAAANASDATVNPPDPAPDARPDAGSPTGGPAGAGGPRDRPRSLRARVRRRLGRQLGRHVRGRPPLTVRAATWDSVEVYRVPGVGVRRYRLEDPHAECRLKARTVTVDVPDAAALARLATSVLLRGKVSTLRIRVATVPTGLRITGVLPRLASTTAGFSWRRRGDGVEVVLTWSRPYEVTEALRGVTAAVLRARPWDQAGGPVFLLDRAAWLTGAASWPVGRLTSAPVMAPDCDDQGRPLGPFLPVPPATVTERPLFATVANPHGRVLSGAAAAYRLTAEAGRVVLHEASGLGRSSQVVFDQAGSPERGLDGSGLSKYAVATVDALPDGDRFAEAVVRALGACGVVFAAAEPSLRARLEALDAVVATPSEVTGPRGYALSVAASRRQTVRSDAALRRTVLAREAGGGEGSALPLPTVSVVLSSKRPDDVDACLGYLATQTYPAYEVVLGTHGYAATPADAERWRGLVPAPLRVVPLAADLTLGTALGTLARIADGEFVAKVDDDDYYGAHHLTDLVLAWYTSGADLVAKGARFVHLPELGKTIDRAWAAPETFNVSLGGGTMLVARSALQEVGGWSTSARHVDTDFVTRVRSAGGLTYRTHSLDYLYIRRTSGHTWATKMEALLEQGEQVYDGVPADLLAGSA